MEFTFSVMKELIASDHKIIMITGDSSLTAADVSRRCGITKSENLLLSELVEDPKDPKKSTLVWKSGFASLFYQQYSKEIIVFL